MTAKRREEPVELPPDRDEEPGAATHDDQPAYNPFLKAPDVMPEGENFQITDGFTRRKSGRFGEQIIMEVVRARDQKTFDFGIGVGSVNHRALARRMGHEQQWRGTINLKRQQGNRSAFVAVNDQNPIPF